MAVNCFDTYEYVERSTGIVDRYIRKYIIAVIIKRLIDSNILLLCVPQHIPYV